MSFVITDYLDSLNNFKRENTWAEAECPVCKGKLKINLSNKSGAYACYTNNCHNRRGKNLIREKLYKPSPFRKSTVFTPNKNFVPKLPIITKPHTLVATDISAYNSAVEYIPPKKTYIEGYGVKTIYLYDEFQVCRIDRNGSKFLYSEHEYKGLYVKGIPSNLIHFPFYKNQYLQPHVFFVEGEKCADALHRINIAAITPHSSIFTEAKLSKIFQVLKTQGLSSIVYLQDNDSIGKRKAECVQNSAWFADINCISINLAAFLSIDVEGYDVADMVEQGYNFRQKLQEILNGYHFN